MLATRHDDDDLYKNDDDDDDLYKNGCDIIKPKQTNKYELLSMLILSFSTKRVIQFQIGLGIDAI